MVYNVVLVLAVRQSDRYGYGYALALARYMTRFNAGQHWIQR